MRPNTPKEGGRTMLQDALGPPEKLAELLRQLRARCLNLLEREEALDPERLIKYVERAYHNTVGAEAWLAHKRGVRNDAEREHGVSDFFTAVIDRLAPPAPKRLCSQTGPRSARSDSHLARRPLGRQGTRMPTSHTGAPAPTKRAIAIARDLHTLMRRRG